MEYEMGLQKKYFDAMKNQTKKIEIRLNDEKRKKIRVGDIINFGLEPDRVKKLKTKVTNLTTYRNFQEVVDNIPLEYLTSSKATREEYLKDLNLYYPQDVVDQYGVLAIEIQKLEKSCGIIVSRKIKDELNILIVKHKDGHWGFPKGHMEEKETEKETALRETWEETGIKARIVGDFRKVITYQPKPNTTKDVVFFQGEVESGEISFPNEEIDQIKWVTIKEAQKLITYQAERQLLETNS